MDNLLQNFERLKAKVLEKRPVLKQILKKRGAKNLHEYADEYVNVNLNPAIKSRQREFLSTFRGEVVRLFNDEIADSAVRQLEKHYFVSTSDHHGPVCHPFFLNSNLVTASSYPDDPQSVLKNVIVLSCSNVSLNNSSFPRGLLFSSYVNDKITMQRLSFLPSNAHSSAVYNFRAYSLDELHKVKRVLRDKVSTKQIRQLEADKLEALLNEIYSRPDVLACETYSDQITKTNFHLWKKFFNTTSVTFPYLLYIEQESLVVKLLLNHHVFADTIINHFLFDQRYEPLIYQYFEGIMGTFSRKDKWGTYLFWGISKDKNFRVSLWKEGNFLVSEDGSFKLELKPEVIKQALEDKQILPSMMLIFIVLSFYYGLKCLGGFNQVNYLTYMKNAYIKMQVDLENYRSIEVCARAQTKELGEDLTVAFLSAPNNEIALATGIDLIIYGHENLWECLVEQSKKITLEEALNPMMPDFYSIIYPESQREKALTEITDKDINRLTHLDEKISPCIRLPN